MDTIIVQVLPDGTIKTTSDAISRPNHAAAEDFLAEVRRLAGGTAKRIRRPDAHTHAHSHQEQRS